MRNPQAFKQFQNLQKSQNDPQEFLKQMMSRYSPEQMKNFKQFANGFGFTNEQLTNFGIK